MKKLPIGIQTFEKIRDGDYVYVDKTAFVHRLITEGSVYFLSRPRRFGKSLLLSTLKAMFQGKRGLFTGLAIDNLPWDWTPRPVLHLDFSKQQWNAPDEIDRFVRYAVEDLARDNGVSLPPDAPLSRVFEITLREIARVSKTVILVDEYDKPILDTLSNPELCRAIRDRLKGFYTAIKSADQHLQFVLLTGVTKFAKISVFSGLNNLNDLTMHPDYAMLCGYADEEIDLHFSDRIRGMAEEVGRSPIEVREKIRSWYNGFRFTRAPATVYSPISVLKLLDTREFSAYWFETATPTFLIDLIRTTNYPVPSMENLRLAERSFSTFEIEDLRVEPLFVQTGYLTIKGYDAVRDEYTLSYPNREVKQAFLSHLVDEFCRANKGIGESAINRLIDAVNAGNVDEFLHILRSFFALVDYDLHIRNEKYYQTIFYLVFALLGLRIKAEEKTADGRIDAVIETVDAVFLFEFKLFDSAENALAQIRDREYFLKYRDYGKKIVLVGVSFDAETKNVGRWVREEMHPSTPLRARSSE